MKKISFLSFLSATVLLFTMGCQKLDRPKLGDYPQDSNPPGGPLKFYVAFDGTSSDPLRNAVDSIKANFPGSNPFSSIDGISGKGMMGADQKAISYVGANDFSGSTSFSISFWEKNTVPGGGNPQFLFSLPSHDYWHQSAMFALVDHDGAGSTTSMATFKLCVQDHWFEFTPTNGQLPGNILNNEWHHIVIVYDEQTSKMTYYVDGHMLSGLNPALTDWKDNGVNHGPVHFNNIYNFVLGGWNKHANLGNGAPTDGWIQSWQGGLDQFRLYGKALTESEVLALYNSKL